MENISTVMWVVAGCLRDAQDRVLLQKRPAGKAHAGLWEFPGGKLEPGEGPENGLIRELAEELLVNVVPQGLAPLSFAEDHSGRIVILLYSVAAWTGEPANTADGEVGWFAIDEAGRLPMPPLDRSLLARVSSLHH